MGRERRAAGGRALLRDGRREPVLLEEVQPDERAPILQRYLEVAGGARPHFPVDRRAPLSEFEAIAPQYRSSACVRRREAVVTVRGGTLRRAVRRARTA